MERVLSYNPGARTGLERKAPTRHPNSVLERLGISYRSTNVYTNKCASNDQCHTTYIHIYIYIYIYWWTSQVTEPDITLKHIINIKQSNEQSRESNPTTERCYFTAPSSGHVYTSQPLDLAWAANAIGYVRRRLRQEFCKCNKVLFYKLHSAT